MNLHKHLLFCSVNVIDCFLLVLDVGESDLECNVLLLIGCWSSLLCSYQCPSVVVLVRSNFYGEILSNLTGDLFNIGITITVVDGDDSSSCLTRGVDVLFKLGSPLRYSLTEATACDWIRIATKLPLLLVCDCWLTNHQVMLVFDLAAICALQACI